MSNPEKRASVSCTIPCDLCGSSEVDELSLRDRDWNRLHTVICRRCGLVYTDPRPNNDEIRDYYEHHYRLDYQSTWQPKPKHVYRAGKVAAARFKKLAPILQPTHRILDIGAGGGEVVFLLRTLGYDAFGIEPNAGYASFAMDVLGMPVAHAFYQDARVDQESVDVITMFHVLEHFDSPCDALRHAWQWLRQDGFLLVEVPNVAAVCGWPHGRFHRAHLYNFNPATLEGCGRKVGYQVFASSVSPDGGNAIIVFVKRGTLSSFSGEIPGNYDRIMHVLRRHTALRHLLTRHPYVRPFRRIAARLEERKVAHVAESPVAILSRLVPHDISPISHADSPAAE